MQILEVYTQGCAALTLGCLTLSALTGLILRFINVATDGRVLYCTVFA